MSRTDITVERTVEDIASISDQSGTAGNLDASGASENLSALPSIEGAMFSASVKLRRVVNVAILAGIGFAVLWGIISYYLSEADRRHATATAREALNAARRVQRRLEVGMTYSQYMELVGEQYAQVKLYVESPEGKKMLYFSMYLDLAFHNYRRALDQWKASLGRGNHDRDDELQSYWASAAKDLDKAEGCLTP
jgi:hypothetical protein